jgi:hypothetical protein
MRKNSSVKAALHELEQAGTHDVALTCNHHIKLRSRVNGGAARTYVISNSPSDGGNVRVVRGGIRRLLRADGPLRKPIPS